MTQRTQVIDTIQSVLLCVSCDGILCPQVGKLCDHCDELLAYDENGHSFPVALGHAIRRFLRRAEVERLAQRAIDISETLVHFAKAFRKEHAAEVKATLERQFLKARRMHGIAVKRLAALALEGT